MTGCQGFGGNCASQIESEVYEASELSGESLITKEKVISRMADHRTDIDSSEEEGPEIVYLEWNLNDDNGDDDNDYYKFITEFRKKLADHTEHNSIRRPDWDWISDHPLLPKEKSVKPTRWMYIKISLLPSGKSTTLVIRDDNVYLIGFMNHEGKTFEFGFGKTKPQDVAQKQSVPIIGEDSTFLNYDSNYRSLLGACDEVSMYRGCIVSAVKSLAHHKTVKRTRNNNLKQHLGYLILMVCETARMYPHLREANRGWKDEVNNTIRFDPQLFGYLRKWQKMSKAVQTNLPRDFASLEGIGICDRKSAFEIVHLIKYAVEGEQARDNEPREEQPEQPAPPEEHQPGQQSPPPAGGGGDQQQQPPPPPPPPPQQQQQGQQRQHKHHSDDGRPMMEVFSLRATNRLSGTIAIFDGKRGQVIYENNGDADAPKEEIREYLVLTGPYRAISADGRVALKHYAVPENDASGQFSKVHCANTFWDSYTNDNLEFQYDKLLTKNITGDLEMSYAVLSSAEEATVQVDVLPSRHVTDVYGDITAETKLPDGKDVSILLFRCKIEEPPLKLVRSFPGSTIPLARSVLAWQFGSPLAVKVGLKTKFPAHEGTSTGSIVPTFSFDDHADKIILEPFEGIGYVRVSINVTGKDWVPGQLTNKMDPAMCVETDYFIVHPPQLCFTLEPDKQMPCLLHVTNDTDGEQVAFRLRPVKESAAGYFHKITEVRGKVPPNTTSTYLVRLEKPPSGSMDELDIILESRVAPKGVEDMDTTFGSPTRATKEIEASDEDEPCEEIDACFQANDEIDKVTIKVKVCDPADKIMTSMPIRQGIKIIPLPGSEEIDLHPMEPWIIYWNRFSGLIHIWNYETMADAMPSARLENSVPSIKFIAPKQWFIAGDSKGYIHVYTCATVMEELRKFEAHEGRVTSLAVHPSKPLVLSSGWGSGRIKLWDWEADWKCIQTFESKDYYTWGKVMFNPFDGNSFAITTGTGVKMWNISSTHPVATLLVGGGYYADKVGCFDYFSTGGDQLFMVTGSVAGTACIWDLKNNRCITQVECLQQPSGLWWRSGTNVAVVQSHLGRPILLTVSRDHAISLYDCITYRCQRTIDLKLGEVNHILYAKRTGSLVIDCEGGIAVMDLDY